MSVEPEIAQILADIQERLPGTRAFFGVELDANGLATYTVAWPGLDKERSPDQDRRLKWAFVQVADAIRDIVNPQTPLTHAQQAEQAVLRG